MSLHPRYRNRDALTYSQEARETAAGQRLPSQLPSIHASLSGNTGHRAIFGAHRSAAIERTRGARGQSRMGGPFQIYSPLDQGWYLGGLAAAMDGRRAGAYRRGGPTMCMWCVAMSFWFVSESTPCRSANIFSNPPGVTPNNSTPGSVPVF